MAINKTITPPQAETIEKIITYHDEKVIDNYFWLREKTNPKVIDYLNQENEYTNARMEHTKALQEEIYKELVKREKEDDETIIKSIVGRRKILIPPKKLFSMSTG